MFSRNRKFSFYNLPPSNSNARFGFVGERASHVQAQAFETRQSLKKLKELCSELRSSFQFGKISIWNS